MAESFFGAKKACKISSAPVGVIRTGVFSKHFLPTHAKK